MHRSFLHKDAVPAVWAPDTAVFIVDLNRLFAVDAPVAHQTSIAASRALCSIARFTDLETVFPIDVLGRYVPPANVCPHFLHFQIPVPMRRTDENPHWVHLCFSCIFSSISATRFLMFLPYRTPNLPADLVFHPLVCFTIYSDLRKSDWSVMDSKGIHRRHCPKGRALAKCRTFLLDFFVKNRVLPFIQTSKNFSRILAAAVPAISTTLIT